MTNTANWTYVMILWRLRGGPQYYLIRHITVFVLTHWYLWYYDDIPVMTVVPVAFWCYCPSDDVITITLLMIDCYWYIGIEILKAWRAVHWNDLLEALLLLTPGLGGGGAPAPHCLPAPLPLPPACLHCLFPLFWWPRLAHTGYASTHLPPPVPPRTSVFSLSCWFRFQKNWVHSNIAMVRPARSLAWLSSSPGWMGEHSIVFLWNIKQTYL